MDLTPETIAWVERVSGGSVVAVERQGRWRPHFFVDVKRPDGEVVPLLVRFPRDPELIAGSAFLSHYDLAHEAGVLEALQATSINVPRYYGFDPSTPAILMARVEGTNDFAEIDAEDRRRLLREYFRNLHELHSMPVDAAAMEALGFAVPQGAEELAFAKMQYMEADYRAASQIMRPEPLLRFALWWLHEHVPQHRDRPSWVQGDTGPGQFMVHEGEITALIDWELSHIGDPMLDLGVMRMRNMLYPVGELGEYFDYYAELAGEPLDQAALCYYTVVSTLLSPLGMAVTIQRPDASVGSMMPRFGWDVTLRRGLCDALCEAYEVEVVAPEIPEVGGPGRADLHRFLVDHLEGQCLPTARSDYDRFLLDGALGVARTLELAERIGGKLGDDDLDDMAAVLGARPTDREAGLAELDGLVAADPAAHALDLLWLFSRMERRREVLWAPMMIAQQSGAFERRYPAKRTLDGPTGSGGR